MVLTDPIADMLTRIRNANTVYREVVEMPASRVKHELALIMKREGYIRDCEVAQVDTQKVLKVTMKYGNNRQRVITGLKRISKPGLRVYVKKDELPRVLKRTWNCDNFHIQRNDDRSRGKTAGSWR